MSLKGGHELRARLKAIRQVFKPFGRDWADETAKLMRPMVPVKTGRLRASIRRKNATQRKATVVAHYSAYFIDAGTKAHTITARKGAGLVFQGRNGTVFAKRVHHPRVAARPFRARAAREALRRKPMLLAVIKAWNAAGKRARGRYGQ